MLALLLAGCARSPLAGRAVEVDRIDEGVATVVDRATGQTLVVPARRLPKDAREGLVLVDGRVDEEATAALRSEVVRARAALRRASPGPGGLDEPPR